MIPTPFPNQPGPFSSRGMPVAAIIPFAGPQADPNHTLPLEAFGWMMCDGRSLPVSEYPELFAVLGYWYGGSSDAFNIPDYRGYFLRMVDLNSGNDPDAATRTPAKNGTATGPGSTQQDALQTHKHTYQVDAASTAPADPGSAALVTTSNSLTGGPTSSLQEPGDVRVSQYETRAKNVYVTYLIKYTG